MIAQSLPLRLLDETSLRQLVPLDTATIDCIGEAFTALATKAVVMPPVLSMAIAEHHGEVDVKTAYIPGLAGFAIKISPGFFDNPARGLPSTTGMMALFEAQTGRLQALLLDNGYLTDIRTAAAGALAARHLARGHASHACIVGAGRQARLQLQALTLVRPIRRATIWARDAAKADRMAAELQTQLGFPIQGTRDLAAAVNAADILVTTTPSRSPLIDAGWLHPGLHITAMGSDQPDKNELDPACLTRADRYVADRQSQTRLIGELRSALAAGLVSADAQHDELGEIAAGLLPGRRDEQQITLCDLTGTGVQDTAIATLASERADATNTGVLLNKAE